MSRLSESFHKLELSDQKINENKNKPQTRKFVTELNPLIFPENISLQCFLCYGVCFLERKQKLFIMKSLTDQILKSDVIPIVMEKELEVECCVIGHHVY